MDLPTGTVTFLFTDLEKSTRLWEEQPESVMRDALTDHDRILRGAIEDHRGVVFSTMGDGMAAVFASAPDALAAALDAQRGLGAHEWSPGGSLRARMGLHSDEGQLRAPGEYVNRPLNRCARLMSVAHAGQVLISDSTAALVRRSLPPDVELVDLGDHRLRDLAEPVHVFQAVHPALGSDFPPLRSLDTVPGNLPHQLTTFIGRDHELADIGALVRQRPLVTLSGVGGVGKTRLAIQVAAEVMPEFPDGAWLCELAAVTDPAAVWETLSASLGVQRTPSRPVDATVVEYLETKRMLILIDNCEHLLDAVAEMVTVISRRCPEVAVLATSREGLAVSGEHLIAVPALQVPSDGADLATLTGSEAVRLFADRASDAKPGFELTDANIAAVSQLCRRLDGIPLAIELAAARVRSLPPDELVTRLDQRFRLLTRGSRASLERHQTLRNTIDWSYDLLNDDERAALTRLSVFIGGWNLRAAEAILGVEDEYEAADLLSQLVDKSLVLVDDRADGTRYRLLETIRQYAQERLEASGETAAVRLRHADYFTDLATAAGPLLRRREQIATAAALHQDFENLRAALDWAVENDDADHALRLVAPLMVTGIPVGWTATNWADMARSIQGADAHDLYPLITAFAAMGAAIQNDLDRAEALLEEAQSTQTALGTDHLWLHAAAGTLALFRGHFDVTVAESQAWADAGRVRGEAYEVTHALTLMAAGLANDPDRAVPVADEGVQIARDLGLASALLYALIVRTNLPADDPEYLLALLEEAAVAAEQLGDQLGLANVLTFRGVVLFHAGDFPAALDACTEAAEQHLRVRQGSAVHPGPFWGASGALARLGELEPAAVLLAYSYGDASQVLDDQSMAELNETRAILAAGLDEGRRDELAARGTALSATEAVALLRAETDRVRRDELIA